jgi:elongation factor P--(R)-beta-lysine ligase
MKRLFIVYSHELQVFCEVLQVSWWHPPKFEEKRPFLEKRSAVIRAIRTFFDGGGFLEVETPILQVCPVMDTHIHAFKTEVLDHSMKPVRELYLHTSPEFAMKKLMVAGLPKIYQVCHVFRNAEGSHRHSLEFTMLEWYRAPGTYRDVMDDCVALLRHVAKVLEIKQYTHKDMSADPLADWEIISVAAAFKKYADITLEDFLPENEESTKAFSKAIASLGIRVGDGDRWDDLFFRVMADRIEPHLGVGVPTIIYDYPASMASLARRCPDDNRFAERFEMYVCGIELCNAFGELTDPVEQRKRFHGELALKNKIYGETYPVDEEFLQALEYGLPESGGNALGVDRLVMLATGADDIAQVLWTAKP